MKEADRAHCVEEALLYLNAADSSLGDYSGAVLLGDEEVTRKGMRLRERLGFPAAVSATELDHLDGIALCGGEHALFQLLRQTPMPRSKFNLFRTLGRIQGYPRACCVESVNIEESGRVTRKDWPFVFHPSRDSWECLTTSYRRTGKTGRQGDWRYEELQQGEESLFPSLTCMASWLRRWAWHIELAPHGGNISLALTTDAIGVKNWFRLRDVPEGMDRRTALLHWVREHWRQHRDDPETEIHVREHLRGRTSFDWFGMIGTIFPSEPDQARAEASRRAKEAMDKLQRRRQRARI